MVGGNASSGQVFVDTAVGGRVEVAANDKRDLIPVAVDWSRFFTYCRGSRRILRETVDDLIDLIHHQRRLNQLHITELRVPMNMHVGNNESRPSLLSLKHAHDSNITLAKDTVKHVLCLLEILPLHRDLTKFDQVFLNQCIPV